MFHVSVPSSSIHIDWTRMQNQYCLNKHKFKTFLASLLFSNRKKNRFEKNPDNVMEDFMGHDTMDNHKIYTAGWTIQYECRDIHIYTTRTLFML